MKIIGIIQDEIIVELSPDDRAARRAIYENRCKFLAELMLAGFHRGVVVPSAEEWHGLNMLERDDGLTRTDTKP